MKINQLAYLAKYFISTKILNKKTPILGGIKLTHNCNLQCRQCPYWQRKSAALTYQQCLEIMDEMYNQGVRLLIFEGGEPLLWRDGDKNLHDLVIEAKKKFFTVGITTNGTYSLNINSDIIWVSIDGLRATHNKLRGNCYDKVITNIRNAEHPNIYANITLNKYNCTEIVELVKEIAPIVKGITIQFFFPYDESDKSLLLSWDERKSVLNKLIELKKQSFPIADSYVALKALITNQWQCHPWMLANADPSGQINYGCYLKNRADSTNPCELCGFAAHTEISLAYDLKLESILSGRRILNIF